MRAATIGFLAAVAFAGAAFAQQSPSEVTDAEIARYKETAQKGCRDAGLARSDPQERVDTFCSCVLATLEKTMKRPEWQQASFYSMKNQEAEERAVLEPHFKNLGVCRVG